MGSTLLTLRNLFEDQILDSQESSASTDPTSTVINLYINRAIRKIARRERPRELMASSPTDLDMTVNQQTVALTSDIFIPDQVYVKDTGGAFRQMLEQRLEQMILYETAQNFFDSTNVADPAYYTVRGTDLLFNKFLPRTETGAVKVFHLTTPATLSGDSDTTEIPIDYDFAIIYEAAVFYYQKVDDVQNQQKFQGLALEECRNIRFDLDTNDSEIIDLDPLTFISNNRRRISNPNVLFGQ